VRAGDKEGRVYRVRRADAKTPATWDDLTRKSDAELVGILGSNNGVMRDLAHRLLLERNATSSASALKDLLKSNKSAAARLQAVYVLDELHSLSENDLRAALADAEAPVRAAAIRVAEGHLKERTIPTALQRMAYVESDPATRLQLAFTLGEIIGRGDPLGKIATNNLADPRMRFAVLSSSTKQAPDVLETVLEVAEKTSGRREMVDGLIRTAASSSDPRIRERTHALVLPKQNEKLEAWQLDAINALLSAGSISKSMAARLDDLRGAAREIATDKKSDMHSRQTALEILGRSPTDRDLQIFAELLATDSPELHKAFLDGLKNSSDPRIADLALRNWAQTSPSMRQGIIGELLKRETWTEQLLTQI